MTIKYIFICASLPFFGAFPAFLPDFWPRDSDKLFLFRPLKSFTCSSPGCFTIYHLIWVLGGCLDEFWTSWPLYVLLLCIFELICLAAHFVVPDDIVFSAKKGRKVEGEKGRGQKQSR